MWCFPWVIISLFSYFVDCVLRCAVWWFDYGFVVCGGVTAGLGLFGMHCCLGFGVCCLCWVGGWLFLCVVCYLCFLCFGFVFAVQCLAVVFASCVFELFVMILQCDG